MNQAIWRACLSAPIAWRWGRGWGSQDWSKAVFEKATTADCPMVLDADGLNLLARQPVVHKRLILTPHPGEAARLLECSIADIQK